MSKPTYNRCIVTGEELKDGIQNGVDSIYAVAKAAYGVSSGNVFIENRADAPTVSHDGVTNIDVLERSDPIEDMTVATIKQASQRTNKTAGDGTTLSAILSCHLYSWAKRKIEAGMSERQVSEIIKSNVPKILSEISKRTKKDLSDKSLRGVCIVSAGEEALGEMIYDVVQNSIVALLNPELTASWEKGLTMVSKGEITAREYTDKLNGFITRRTEGVLGLSNQYLLKDCYENIAGFYKK